MNALKGSQAFTRSVTSCAGLAAAMLLGFAVAAGGGTNFWTNTVGSAFIFNEAANWDTAAAPGGADDAIFNAPDLHGAISFTEPVSNASWVFQSGDITINGDAGTAHTLSGAGSGISLNLAPDSAVTVRVTIASGRFHLIGGLLAGRNGWPSGSAHPDSHSELVISGAGTVVSNYARFASIMVGENAPASLIITNGACLVEATPATGDEHLNFCGRNDTIFHVTGPGSHLYSRIYALNFPALHVTSASLAHTGLVLFDNGATAYLRGGIRAGWYSGRGNVRVTGVGTEIKYRHKPIRLGAHGYGVGTLEILDGGMVIADSESSVDLNIGEYDHNSVTGAVTIAGGGSMFWSPYDQSVAIRIGSSPVGAYGSLIVRDGGSLIATNANLGAGRSVHAYVVNGLVSMEGGTMKVDHLTATNTTSTLRFVMGTTGSGTITLKGDLTVSSNTKLVVDDADYAVPGEVELIRYGAQVGALAPDNISVTGRGSVVEDAPNNRIVYRPPPMGTIVIVR
ncbi:MAG: hypothetical protein PHR35_06420 [Kiritimatiellae bacterium]|nr:hypothetical protein [Kiritimatiellia bacterium]